MIGFTLADRPKERLSPGELAIVLSHYDLGPIESITEFARGSQNTLKIGIVSSRGKFLLKRRQLQPPQRRQLAYSHRLQAHLQEEGFPLPKLVPPPDSDILVHQYGGHTYELFEYARGQTYSKTLQETRDAGAMLAKFHRAVEGFEDPDPPSLEDYHDADSIRRALSSLYATLSGHDSIAGQEADALELGQELFDAYEHCARAIAGLNLRSWPTGVIHSDWHPGNMLFRNEQVIAVVDYDAVRLSQRILDVANGTLQFSIYTGPRIEDWPDQVDDQRAEAFLEGYLDHNALHPQERACLVYLMTEALIAESILPIAATGRFGQYQGYRFLKMVRRKVSWLLANAEQFTGSLIGLA